MVSPVKRRATYADLIAVPDRLVAEIVDGDLYASPRPTPRQALAASALAGQLEPPFQRGKGGPGGWWILFEPELHLAEEVLVPDLAGWKRERRPTLPEAPALTLAPDWACEMLSPGTETLDRARKMPVYAREGVGHLWIVSPVARTLEAYRRTSEGWLLLATHEGSGRFRVVPFEAIELDVTALWGEAT